MRRSSLFFTALAGAVAGGGIVALAGYFLLIRPTDTTGPDFDERQRAGWLAGMQRSAGGAAPQGLNFTYAAAAARPAVVHIQTSYGRNGRALGLGSRRRSPWDLFGDNDPYHQPQQGDGYDDNGEGGYGGPIREASGSGVIISDDGYIATNNHVIADAAEITVVLDDKRRYKARLIGTDATTDLALLRINAQNLPYARYGNSDSLSIGEWVLAVGNPFDLTSTVTAGIVSAKGRNINILAGGRDNMTIESFIQTDAAVNPGNSGGALVDLHGRLIGINTAIASNTGSYTGYSFAVPVTLVRKVMDDLLKYGQVQRALLGVSIRDVDAELAEQKSIPDTRGVYVDGVLERGAAGKAGVKAGDVILKINGVEVNSVSALQEYVARYRPGDKVRLLLERGKATNETEVTLRTAGGADKLSQATDTKPVESEKLGATFRAASAQLQSLLGIIGGVEVVGIHAGSVLEQAGGMGEGFIITHVDKKPVTTPAEVEKLLTIGKGGVLIEGLYPDGRRAYYGLGLE